MKKVYGYIRVSDQKQVDGASLSEQERAITEYAKKNNLIIFEWFKETKTAAKKGRPEFTKMMGLLRSGKVDGVIIHKIDRSARNLHDWAALGDLIDYGIQVYFAHESLDMNERGGRLSADIQAVMASDYVRNLRQEAIKGLYGRLKQGIYPFRAPIGYLDNGRGEVKTVDVRYKRLIIMLFELYVHHNHSILSLIPIMKEKGLRNWRGNALCKNAISRILNNPFYMGLMKVKGRTFEGKHEPIISPRLYKQAQLKLNGNVRIGVNIHDYLFRGLMKCHLCGRSMIGEFQKNMVYYRCHKKGCPTKSVREDSAERSIKNFLRQIKLTENEIGVFEDTMEKGMLNSKKIEEDLLKGINLNLNSLIQKEQKLLDAYLDNLIDKDDYNLKKEKIKHEILDLKYREQRADTESVQKIAFIRESLELCKNPINMYDSATREEKRMMVKMIGSNFVINEKKIMILPSSPYSEVAFRDKLVLCEHKRDRTRTLSEYIIYSDNNTSPTSPKPMNKEEIKKLYDILVGKSEPLVELKTAPKTHEL